MPALHNLFKNFMKPNSAQPQSPLPWLFLILLFFPAVTFSQVHTIWALGDGEKVFRNDTSHPDKAGNLIWDGKTIHLKGLYNEVLAFQLILEAGKDSVKSIEVAVEAPVHKASGKAIGGNNLKYG